MKVVKFASALAAAITMTGAQAALYDRGGGMIYDDVLKITWLQDANYARTSGYDADGKMTYAEATAWASNLKFGGYNDWRLPTINSDISFCNSSNWSYAGGDCGFNVRTVEGGKVISEMAHMYYNNMRLNAYLDPSGAGIYPTSNWGIFGNGTSNGVDLTTYGEKDLALFTNVQAYMYGLGKTNVSGNHQFVFFMLYGEQNVSSSDSEVFAWAVRDGDVAPVPAPPAFILMLTGLGLLGFARRLRKEV